MTNRKGLESRITVLLFVLNLVLSPLYAEDRRPITGFGFGTPSLSMENRGSFVAYIGWGYRNHWRTPLYDLYGDCHRFGSLGFDLFLSRFVYLRIRGDIQQCFWYEGSHDIPEIKTSGNPLYDIGDFSVATVMTFLEKDERWRIGIQVENGLPNTNQNKGLGCNSLKINLSLLSEWSTKSTVLCLLGGIGIWEAPRNKNMQNDVLLYGLRVTKRIKEGWFIGTGVQGFLSTARTTPLGTESRGFFNAGFLWRGKKIEFHFFPEYGLQRREGTWGFSTGIGIHHSLFPPDATQE